MCSRPYSVGDLCAGGSLSYHSGQERLEGCVLIQDEQFLAGEEIIDRLF